MTSSCVPKISGFHKLKLFKKSNTNQFHYAAVQILCCKLYILLNTNLQTELALCLWWTNWLCKCDFINHKISGTQILGNLDSKWFGEPHEPPKVWPFFNYIFKNKSKVFHILTEKKITICICICQVYYLLKIKKMIILNPKMGFLMYFEGEKYHIMVFNFYSTC